MNVHCLEKGTQAFYRGAEWYAMYVDTSMLAEYQKDKYIEGNNPYINFALYHV